MFQTAILLAVHIWHILYICHLQFFNTGNAGQVQDVPFVSLEFEEFKILDVLCNDACRIYVMISANDSPTVHTLSFINQPSSVQSVHDRKSHIVSSNTCSRLLNLHS